MTSSCCSLMHRPFESHTFTQKTPYVSFYFFKQVAVITNRCLLNYVVQAPNAILLVKSVQMQGLMEAMRSMRFQIDLKTIIPNNHKLWIAIWNLECYFQFNFPFQAYHLCCHHDKISQPLHAKGFSSTPVQGHPQGLIPEVLQRLKSID